MKTHEHIELTDRAESQLDVPPPGKARSRSASSRWVNRAESMFRRGEYQESKMNGTNTKITREDEPCVVSAS